ncbi:hypothetical protein HG535_0H04320 [Zygotorulaspora mrakii]|uniref:Putative peptidase domain-containing protein n=1 Tax=Zygotorulaspora mrakii TaxID=42260 RepID=A0A7H9B8T9_ZYGMR|nr:uncharacterized protein HG535_0H04320 [Zygotorulaspora mrakii]QLG75105.1 hypothetical protein HG535_0H04320 [Zygotorulaspora mrakii]
MKFSTACLATFASLTSSGMAAPVYNTNSSAELQSAVSQEIFGWTKPTFPELYHTCNSTNARMLNVALQESLEVSAYAKDRLLKYGADDVYYKRWFGNGSIFTVMGVFDHLVESSKSGVLFRCDDVEGLCAANPGYYAGHHRVSVPAETVICDYFYMSKKPISSICFEGNIIDVGPSHYAGIDLFHRYLHVPSMNLDYVGEYAEELDELIDYAENNSTFAVRNTDNYLYYMADVYSSSIVPGGCLGELS